MKGKEKENKSDGKRLFLNFASLSFVQGLNYIFPLILIPYIVRVIGPGKYGVFSFAVAVSGYFSMLTDWGISLYGPREVAFIKEKRSAISHLFFQLLYLRILSALLLSALYFFIVFTVRKFNHELPIFSLSALYIITAALSINWFFLGIEKTSFIALSQAMSKVLWATLVVSLIRGAEDYYLLPLTYGLSALVGSFLLFWWAFSRGGIRPVRPEPGEIKRIAKEALPLFLSNISVRIYTGINTVLLGFLASPQAVGYYSLGERLVKALLGIQSQVSVVFYPHISSQLKKSIAKARAAIKRGILGVFALALPLNLLVFLLAKPIIIAMGGVKFLPSVIVLRLLSFLFIVVGASNVAGLQILLPFGRRKEFMKATIAAAFLNLLLGGLTIPFWKEVGAAISFLISELLILVLMGRYVLKLKNDLL